MRGVRYRDANDTSIFSNINDETQNINDTTFFMRDVLSLKPPTIQSMIYISKQTDISLSHAQIFLFSVSFASLDATTAIVLFIV